MMRRSGRLAGFLFAIGILGGGLALGQDALSDGPNVSGPYGPMSASDANRNGQVTRDEIENFMRMGPERQVGMVAYFDQYDADQDGLLTAKELAAVEPPYAFDGSDCDAGGVVSREEVEEYVDERLYRQMSLGDFFTLIDTDESGVVTEAEMIAAQQAGQLPIEDVEDQASASVGSAALGDVWKGLGHITISSVAD